MSEDGKPEDSGDHNWHHNQSESLDVRATVPDAKTFAELPAVRHLTFQFCFPRGTGRQKACHAPWSWRTACSLGSPRRNPALQWKVQLASEVSEIQHQILPFWRLPHLGKDGDTEKTT